MKQLKNVMIIQNQVKLHLIKVTCLANNPINKIGLTDKYRPKLSGLRIDQEKIQSN